MIDFTAKIHPLAFIDESAEIGPRCVVWQFASVLANVKLGEGVSIGAGAEIGAGSVIGKDARISAQCFLPSNSVLGERVFLGPGVKATDDRYPRAGNHFYNAEPPTIENGASLGAGSILLPGVKVGLGALIAAGSVVTKDVEPHGHVRGEPARSKQLSIAPVTRQELFVGMTVAKGDEHIA